MGGYVIILFYCITCIVSALYMLNTGMYGGEAYSVGRVHFSFIEIIVHLLIVVLGYFCIYRFYNRTKDKKTKYKIKYNVKRLDKLYFRFLSVRLNRLKNKLLANYLRNRGNDLATVRNSAFCVAILSNNSFICKYNIFFRKYELSVAIL